MSGRIISQVGNQAVVEISSQETPELGSSVSIDGKKIGSVFDVIGNVEKPHVVVRLSSRDNRNIVGCNVLWGR